MPGAVDNEALPLLHVVADDRADRRGGIRHIVRNRYTMIGDIKPLPVVTA
jgi:hypothetical protein